jgi:hypothetical protein
MAAIQCYLMTVTCIILICDKYVTRGPESMSVSHSANSQGSQQVKVEWSWELEHADRMKETKADAAFHGLHPFQIDRKVLMDIVREALGTDVGRIVFLSSGEYYYFTMWCLYSSSPGTFHKVYSQSSREILPSDSSFSLGISNYACRWP